MEGEVFHIETINTTHRHWTNPRTPQMFAQIAKIDQDMETIDMKIDLHKVFTSASNFIKSPAEVETHRKVDLEDKIIKTETKEKFQDLCTRYDDIISKCSDDIGKTLLVEMDIDTGDSHPIACRPYTLPLKHHDWVKKEIEILDRAGIIDKRHLCMGITSHHSTKEIQARRATKEKNVCRLQKTKWKTT